MNNILMLTHANLRKNKGQTVSLLIFVLIAAVLLNIGLVLLTGIGNFIDERAKENHSAHITAIYSSQSSVIEEGQRYMESYPGVTETEKLEVIGGMGSIFMNDLESPCMPYLSPIYQHQKMDAPSLIGDRRPLYGDAIYVPYFIILGGNYKIGDDFKLVLSGVELKFRIAGATEEIMFGAQTTNIYRFYISDERFEKISEQLPNDEVTFLSMRLENAADDIFFYADYSKDVGTDGLHFVQAYSFVKQQRTMIPNIAAIVVTVFSIILLAVSLIVIRFRIVNSIEESMTNIGAQKAIGYRSVQIVLSIMVQFTCIAAIGGILGVALAQIAIPVIASALEPMIALIWRPEFFPGPVMISIITVVLAVSLISFLSAQRIGKLLPLTALRGGMATHSFKKNSLPLDKARGPLGLLLAMKQLLQKKKQAVAIGVIVAALTMASVAGIAVSHSMGGTGESFARAFFGEMPDAGYYLRDARDGEAVKESVLARTDVRNVFSFESGTYMLLVDETSVASIIVEDCTLLEGNMLVQGRYPRHNNEIALGSPISKVAGKGIGDKVMVRRDDHEKEYLVTGIVQAMNNSGFNAMLTNGGFSEVHPDFKSNSYFVYLEDGADINKFVSDIQSLEGDMFELVINNRESTESMMTSMSGIFSAVAAGIVAVTALVVVLVLYMVIKTTILQTKRELGIQKAVGFTTFQLMNQIALNMTPKILLGVVVGAFAGYFGLNPMMLALMGGMGIVKAELPVPLAQTIMICLVLVAFAYCVSMLIARRIRKISAYSLVME